MTFSIVARDERTGQLGVGVQTHWFSAGSAVPWAIAGVGAAAVQSFSDPHFGILALDMLSCGKTAAEAVESLLSVSRKRKTSQVAVVDSKGNVAAHTGEECFPFAGQTLESHFSCQANIMKTNKVWGAMARFYKSNPRLEFPDRLIGALDAGQAAGGDVRGKQSAALLIVSANPTPTPSDGILMDLRVEDHSEPIQELRRFLRLRRAYDFADRADLLFNSGQFKESSKYYSKAIKFAPEIDEFRYWKAIGLVKSGRLRIAEPILRRVFKSNPDLIKLTERLADSGLFPKSKSILHAVIPPELRKDMFRRNGGK